MVPVGGAVEGAVVEVRHLGVVFVDEVLEHVVDAQLELIFNEEGQDLFDGQSVLMSSSVLPRTSTIVSLVLRFRFFSARSRVLS